MAPRAQLTNVYLISGFATIGGMIQGYLRDSCMNSVYYHAKRSFRFDVSSLSAIIGTDQVHQPHAKNHSHH